MDWQKEEPSVGRSERVFLHLSATFSFMHISHRGFLDLFCC